MPYNNYYPVGYQPFVPQYNYNQPYQPQTQPVQQPVPNQQATQNQAMASGIIWVQGEAGAKSYLVAPNTTVQLWDSENQTIYLKSADASGMPSIKTLDYTIREMPQANAPIAPTFDSTAFATKDEVNVLAQQISALQGKLEGLTAKSAPRAKKDVNEDG